MAQNIAETPGESEVMEEVNSNFSSFNKKEILKQLIENGFSDESLDNVILRFRKPKSVVVDFLNKMLRESETYLYQECSSFCFNNIEAWLKNFQKYNATIPSEALAEYVGEIANTEDFPEPAQLNGIDMRAMYLFMKNALLGTPQAPLNDETANFLTKQVELLIEEINNDEGDEAAYDMYGKLEDFEISPQILDTLDPLRLGR